MNKLKVLVPFDGTTTGNTFKKMEQAIKAKDYAALGNELERLGKEMRKVNNDLSTLRQGKICGI